MTTTTSLLEVVALTRPRLARTFGDENAGAVIGAVTDAIRQIGRGIDCEQREISEACDAVRTEMMSGDNDHLLDVARRYVTFAGDERGE